jgi:hypothetical protein
MTKYYFVIVYIDTTFRPLRGSKETDSWEF